MNLTTEEQKRITEYRREGKSEDWIQGWLKGWRMYEDAEENELQNQWWAQQDQDEQFTEEQCNETG